MPMMAQREGYGPPTPVPIFQWEDEFTRLLDLYRERQPRRVLEIGTYYGGTLYHWLTNAQPAVVVTVDSYAVGVDNRAMYDDWRPAGTRLVVIDGDSRDPDVIEAVRRRGPFDWTFIDAGHYYAEVKADWDNYAAMRASGGLVILHDILPPTQRHPEIEVARLWEELKAAGYDTTEIVADRDAEWGGIGIVWA